MSAPIPEFQISNLKSQISHLQFEIFNFQFSIFNSQFSIPSPPPQMTPSDAIPSHENAAPRFIRAVGLFGLIAIAVNGVIGSGIFVLPATVAALLGPASPVAYIVAAALTALMVACFAEQAACSSRPADLTCTRAKRSGASLDSK
jgi:hypothetical protein